MSLLADILDLLRNILQYFGVPADMLVPVWENQYCGQYRSIVRMIGTNLPLSPHARVHFQIPMQTFHRHGSADIPLDGPAIPSLADVMWLAEDDGELFAKFRNDVRPLNRRPTSQPFTPPRARALVRTRPALGIAERNFPHHPPTEALRKITALEDELLMLRAQIAMIVTMPSGPAPLQSTAHTLGMSLPPPVLTSTPGPAPRCPPLPPPPPPPPLPPHCPATMEIVAQGSIKQRRTAGKPERNKDQKTGSTPDKVPSMLDVLKDLTQVKLRAVDRSPGGTPVMKRSKKTVSLSDPAALIAEALRRKFAHRHKEDSFDKENRSIELSPFGSPEIVSIPHNIRRSQGRLQL
ncbi:hypothetical protein AAFF_G00217130 [Aldrovandia affinis]|uniref:Mitochondrial fission regulator n=1 Tax=Aldrovandia affinis TaxID=143900 RepID=A0AAD7SVN5_9TELE|nr:hypothetical protein AAFF_G00217130 [Aldrovandia affinis]